MIQKEHFGYGSIGRLRKAIERYRLKRILLVTGKASYFACGAERLLRRSLSGCDIFRFCDFAVNPRLNDVEEGIGRFKQHNCDGIVAVGGGSVIDMAKLINIFAAQKGAILQYIQGKRKIENRGKPLIAVPTTAGTGSETTHFAVLYVDKVKYSVDNPHILPDVAIIDPQLTLSMPPHLTAATGMDALAQAIESYWCINSTKKSKEYAREAIALIVKNLLKAVNNPSRRSRWAMSKAAHLSGRAIDITKTTLSHAISYPLTSYFKVDHGHAVGLTLGSVLAYNSGVSAKDVADKRGVCYVKKTIDELNGLLGCSDARESRKMIHALMQAAGLKTRLSYLGVTTQEDMRTILDNVDIERAENNPRAVTRRALRQILSRVM